jgi:hypothetical protein
MILKRNVVAKGHRQPGGQRRLAARVAVVKVEAVDFSL